MKKYILLLLLSGSFISLPAQQTKKITQKLPDGTKEEFYVLTDPAATRNGPYIHKDRSGDLIAKGNFVNGKREGLWENYYWGSLAEKGYYKNDMKDSLWQTTYKGKIIEHGLYKNGEKTGFWEEPGGTGNYVNGIRTGEWTFISSEGKKEKIYDYTSKKVKWYDTSSFTIKQLTFKILIGADSQEVVLDCPPMFIDGSHEINRFLMNNVRYPVVEKENGIMGTVYISFDIDTTGKARNFRVFKSVSPGLDKESLRVLALTEDFWTPAMYQGKAVCVRMVQPVRFILQ